MPIILVAKALKKYLHVPHQTSPYLQRKMCLYMFKERQGPIIPFPLNERKLTDSELGRSCPWIDSWSTLQ